MARRFLPHAHTCGTSPGWLGSMGARIPEANIDICRLVQNSRSVTHHEASMTCTVETLEARLVREQSGGGQWACQVAGHADDQQPSSGRGRLRRREGARRRFDSVRKRVNERTTCHANEMRMDVLTTRYYRCTNKRARAKGGSPEPERPERMSWGSSGRLDRKHK